MKPLKKYIFDPIDHFESPGFDTGFRRQPYCRGGNQLKLAVLIFIVICDLLVFNKLFKRKQSTFS